MKLLPTQPAKLARAHAHERGMAVILVMTLISLLLLYVAFNARTLYHLGRELKFIEQKQTQRLSESVTLPRSAADTNQALRRTP